MHHAPFQAIDDSRCKCCKDSNKKIVARGMCKQCYDKWYNTNKTSKNKKTQPTHDFPRKHIVEVWETSDGREWSQEVEALRHEVELFRKG